MPRDKGSLVAPQHRWRAETGEGGLNRSPFLWVHKAGQPLRLQPDMMLHVSAGRRELNSQFQKREEKKELHRFVISNRYDTTFN